MLHVLLWPWFLKVHITDFRNLHHLKEGTAHHSCPISRRVRRKTDWFAFYMIAIQILSCAYTKLALQDSRSTNEMQSLEHVLPSLITCQQQQSAYGM